MDRLGSAKWLEIFERFRDLKKVEKHCSMCTNSFPARHEGKTTENLVDSWERARTQHAYKYDLSFEQMYMSSIVSSVQVFPM